ncbi:MAG TPA: hypothetical protein VJQ59_16785 [Candidatus Sulfotelmatobacter sp.]|nr:hypothetical protein [Candidatus Sulfotelmatobacter sp.]
MEKGLIKASVFLPKDLHKWATKRAEQSTPKLSLSRYVKALVEMDRSKTAPSTKS